MSRNSTPKHGSVFQAPLAVLQPAKLNDRIYRLVSPDDPETIDLANSIREFGVMEPFVCSLDHVIVSGHRRRVACQLVGIETVPCRLEKVWSGTPEFAALLVAFNRQRIKAAGELIREEVVRTSPNDAHAELLAYRKAELTRARKRLDNSGLRVLTPVAAKRRSEISDDKRSMLDAAVSIIEKYRDYWPLTIRQIHYRLLTVHVFRNIRTRLPYVNDQRSYKDLSDLLTRARVAELVPWESIHDPTRPTTEWKEWDNVRAYVREQFDGFLRGYRGSLLRSQSAYVELVVEKLAALDIAERAAGFFHVPVGIGKGYNSATKLDDTAERFRASGKDHFILVVANDFDPEGEDIPEQFGRCLRDEHGVENLTVVKAAVNPDHVSEYGLAGQPVKEGKHATRAPKFKAKHGSVVYELEAFEPDVLQRIIRDTIRGVTGVLPTRVAAADLNGDGLDDLVAAADLGRTLTVAYQRSDGTFASGPVLPIGRAPAELLLTDLDGHDGPDIVAAEQGAGQVRVYYNDPQHTFARSARFRAGFGPFGFDSSSGIADVSSIEETVSLVAGHFDAGLRPDLVAVNRGSNRVNTLRTTADGFAAPQPGLSLSTSTAGSINDDPGQAVAADLNGDGRTDLAILMQDTAEVDVYRGNGDGTFTLQDRVPAGLQPTGLSVADVNGDGNADLLVGNGFGDILFVPGNGDGTFRPFVRSDQRVPFVATDLNGDGTIDVVLANQARDQAVAELRDPGRRTFSPGAFQRDGADGLIGPGAVAVADLDGRYGTDLIFANSGSNNVLVYLRQPDGGFSDTPLIFPVGTNPVGLTVGQLNGDALPDLVVADEGSNDVTVLLGSTTADGAWTFRLGPRLNTGGAGPNSVTVRDSNGDGVPDLLVTNGQSGSLAVLPGIGNQGVGTGFFRDTAPQVAQLTDGTVTQTVIPPGTDRGFAVTGDGELVGFDLASFATGAIASGFHRFVTGLGAFDVDGETMLATANSDGSVSLLGTSDGTSYAERDLLTSPNLDNPSALQVLRAGEGFEVYVTRAGDSQPLVLSFALDAVLPPAAPPPPEPSGGTSGGTAAVAGKPLALLVALLTTESVAAAVPSPAAVDEGGTVPFAEGGTGILVRADVAAAVGEVLGDAQLADGRLAIDPPAAAGADWERFVSGVIDALREAGLPPAPRSGQGGESDQREQGAVPDQPISTRRVDGGPPEPPPSAHVPAPGPAHSLFARSTDYEGPTGVWQATVCAGVLLVTSQAAPADYRRRLRRPW
jgi:hypothetical protein